MNWFFYCIERIFPSSFDKAFLATLPTAPNHEYNFIFPVYNYQNKKTKKLIRYLKNHNDFVLQRSISKCMYEYMREYLSEQQQFSYFKKPIILPVPTSKKNRVKRGFNQTENLARYFAKLSKGNYYKNIIIKKAQNKKQALITNKKERFSNVHNTFFIKPEKENILKNADVIIIDDLSTTGATLLEIKKLLKKSGARDVIAVTIAH